MTRKVRLATRTELVALGKESTPLGLAALALAARLDDDGTAASAMAPIAKELRAIMTELARNTAKTGDPVDELRKRREARRQRGA